VWCETLPYDELASFTQLLARYRVDLLLAVRPWQLADAGDVVRRFQSEGVFVGLWPMIANEDGRWASAASHEKFIAFADKLSGQVPFADEMIIDLEPPLFQLERWKAGRPTWRQTPTPRAYRTARDAYVSAVERWRARHRVTTAVMPLVAIELRGQWLQRVMGTPASDLPVDRHSVMAYTSLMEGWSRGVINRGRAEALLLATAHLTRIRFGPRAGLSLGTVGTGAFGDEPSYRDPGELARDVALALRGGVTELSLFDLGGVVRRPPAEAWFDALCV